MFGLGIAEILVILVVALIVLGPEKLPDTARQLGRMTAELRRAFDDLRHDVSFHDKKQFDIGRLTSEFMQKESSMKGTCEDSVSQQKLTESRPGEDSQSDQDSQGSSDEPKGNGNA